MVLNLVSAIFISSDFLSSAVFNDGVIGKL